MKTLKVLAIILFSLFYQSICQDIVRLFNDLTLTVQGQCGGIVITVNYTINGTLATDTFTAKINSLVERDSNGIAIEDPNHTFTDFCGLDFTVDEFSKSLWGGREYLIVESNANITSNTNSTITVYAILFTQDEMIETGANELVEVKPGYVKFAFEIDNWQFCTNSSENCTGINCCLQGNGTQIGAYLDLSFEVGGNQNATSHDNLTYDLGNSNLILSQYYSIDDNPSTQLISNDPLFQSQGNNNIFTIRFPAFNNLAQYDLIVSMNRVDRNNSIENIGLIIGMIVVIIALLFAFYFYRYFKRNRMQENLIA